MYDIPIGFVRIFSAGHYNEELVPRVDDFDVVDGELTVERDGHDCLHRTFVEELSDFDIGDLHDVNLRMVLDLRSFDDYSIKYVCDNYSMERGFFCEYPFAARHAGFTIRVEKARIGAYSGMNRCIPGKGDVICL